MSLSVAGVWAVDVWAQTVWADGVWREGEYVVVQTQKDGSRNKKFKERKKLVKSKEQLEVENIFGTEETPEEFISRITEEVVGKPIPKTILQKSEKKTLQNVKSVVEYIKKIEYVEEIDKKQRLEAAVKEYVARKEQERMMFIRQQEELLLWLI